MPDYEALAEEIAKPESPPPARTREFYPLDHPKYQGIARAKGYVPHKGRIERTNYHHEAMIDLIIAEPTLTQKEVAARLGRSPNWVSIVIGSDSFQAALAKRREDLIDPLLLSSIEDRLQGLAQQSLEVIAEKLQQTQNVDIAFKGLDIATRALGYGARSGSGAQIQNNFVVQLPSKAQDSAEWSERYSN